MKILHKLFSNRRWLLWLPAAPVAALGVSNPAHLPAFLVGGALLSAPYWLAWWLSDGFATVSLGAPGTAPIESPDDGPALYYNYAEGHYQSNPGPSAFHV